MNRAAVGILGEIFAAIFLLLRGFLIIGWRYRVPGGEVDILAWKRGRHVAFEVKTMLFRRGARDFSPELHLDDRKVRAMFRAAVLAGERLGTRGRVEVGFVAIELTLGWPWVRGRVVEGLRYF